MNLVLGYGYDALDMMQYARRYALDAHAAQAAKIAELQAMVADLTDIADHDSATIERITAERDTLRKLSTCQCGDGFTEHDRGTCGNCMAARTSADSVTIDALREELARLRGQSEWKGIESAPKDGSEFVVCNTKQGHVKRLVSWNTIHEFWQSKGNAIFMQADLWTPLPQVPAEGGKGEAG